MKARVIATIPNDDRSMCCSKCGTREIVRVVELDSGSSQTSLRAYCIPCSGPILQNSTGDPRE